MKNSLLIVLILALIIFAYQTNYKLSNKPLVDYTISNSFPAVSGDTVNIQFQFHSRSDLKFFVANLQSEIGGDQFNEKVEFAGGKKTGDLSYSFIVPNNYHLESLLNFNFTVANKFSSEQIFISIPIYNPPHDLLAELEPVNKNAEFIIESFFSSRSLMLTNDMLADINELENFSNFTIEDLSNFKMSNLEIKKQNIKPKELIASNLINNNEELIRNDDEVLAANFISLSSLSEIIESENLINSNNQDTKLNIDETKSFANNQNIQSQNIVSNKMSSSIKNETQNISEKLKQNFDTKPEINTISKSESVKKNSTIKSPVKNEDYLATLNSSEDVNTDQDIVTEIHESEKRTEDMINQSEELDFKLEKIDIEIKTLTISEENKLVNLELDAVKDEFSSLGVALAKSSEIEIQIK